MVYEKYDKDEMKMMFVFLSEMKWLKELEGNGWCSCWHCEETSVRMIDAVKILFQKIWYAKCRN